MRENIWQSIQGKANDGHLYQYQVNGCEWAFDQFASGIDRALLISPTGSGKTEIAMRVIKLAREVGMRVSFLVHRKRIVLQTSDRFAKAGLCHGLVQADNTRGVHNPLLVCSIDTLARRGMSECDLIIIDEAHDVPGSKAYLKILKGHRGKVLFLTATPYSKGMVADIDELGKLCQTWHRVTTLAELIKIGYLSEYQTYTGKLIPKTEFKMVGGDVDQALASEEMSKPHLVGDVATTWIEKAPGLKTLIFAQSVSHSMALTAEFRRIGISAEHIDCNMTEDVQKEIFDRFNRGEFKILLNFGILTTGWDCPDLECLVVARITKSINLWLQMTGRLFRKFGNVVKTLIDHGDNYYRLGSPSSDFGLDLCDGTRRAPERLKALAKPVPRDHACKVCRRIKEPGERKCRTCGHEPAPPNPVFYQPQKLELAEVENSKSSGKKTVAEKLADRDRSLLYAQLLGHVEQVNDARARQGKEPMKKGAAWHMFKKITGTERQGRDPKPQPPDDLLCAWIKQQQIAFVNSQKGKKSWQR